MFNALPSARILVIGTGNMAAPLIRGIVTCPLITPGNVTFITGTTQGKDSTALADLIRKSGAAPESFRIVSRNAPAAAAATNPLPDIIIYCAKPHYLTAIAAEYEAAFRHCRLFISIAAGVECDTMWPLLGADTAIIRAMPHLPQTLCGYYAEPAEALAYASPFLSGLGEEFILSNESEMHAYATHAASGPAFVAYFLARQDDMSRDANTSELRDLAAAAPLTTSATSHFYQNWRRLAASIFGKTKGTALLNRMITGTLDYLQNAEIPLLDFAQQVRSPKGITNAGLLYMGNPCPVMPQSSLPNPFGSAEELATQTTLAKEHAAMPIENTIIAALIATEERSRAIAQGQGNNPLAGIDAATIHALARRFTETEPQ